MIRTLLFALVLPAISLSAASDSEVASTNEAEDGETIRVMSYNIRHGRGMDGEVNLRRIATVIRQEQPDIVALQEVDRYVPRSGGRDIAAELAALTGMTEYFAKNYSVQGGEYGNAFLSRFPILEQKNTHLNHIEQGEQRGILQMVVEVKGHRVLVLNTHLAHRASGELDRLFSVEQAMEVISHYPKHPVIFVGDFNDRPGSRVHRRLKENFIDSWEGAGEGDGFTHASDQPNKRIDYIWLARDSGLTLRRAWVVPTLASDHLPLVADIEVTDSVQ